MKGIFERIQSIRKAAFVSILAFASLAGNSQAGDNATQNEPDLATRKLPRSAFKPGELWYDTNGEIINAHRAEIIFANNRYYWTGEKRGRRASEGVNVYSSTDLYNWTFEALALSPHTTDTSSDIARGCVMERPKVIYNRKTGKYVMWFHLELRGKGYSAARAGVAVS